MSQTLFIINSSVHNQGTEQPNVTNLEEDGFVVTSALNPWSSDENSGIYGQRYDSTGSPADSEFQVSTYTKSRQMNPFVT
jgi:hypothetical protein